MANARSRTKYEEGLPDFANETAAGDGAQFAVMDLRCDRSYRQHATIGTWDRNGSTLILFASAKKLVYQISADGTKLLKDGSVAYVR